MGELSEDDLLETADTEAVRLVPALVRELPPEERLRHFILWTIISGPRGRRLRDIAMQADDRIWDVLATHVPVLMGEEDSSDLQSRYREAVGDYLALSPLAVGVDRAGFTVGGAEHGFAILDEGEHTPPLILGSGGSNDHMSFPLPGERNYSMPIEFAVLDGPPERPGGEWDDVQEISIRPNPAIWIKDSDRNVIASVETGGEPYRLRYSIAGSDLPDLSPYLGRYRIEVWPAPVSAPATLVQRSRWGKYWADEQATRIANPVVARPLSRAGFVEALRNQAALFSEDDQSEAAVAMRRAVEQYSDAWAAEAQDDR